MVVAARIADYFGLDDQKPRAAVLRFVGTVVLFALMAVAITEVMVSLLPESVDVVAGVVAWVVASAIGQVILHPLLRLEATSGEHTRRSESFALPAVRSWSPQLRLVGAIGFASLLLITATVPDGLPSVVAMAGWTLIFWVAVSRLGRSARS